MPLFAILKPSEEVFILKVDNYEAPQVLNACRALFLTLISLYL